MLATYYGFWDYWELRHKVTFDGINKLIIVNEGITNLDAQIDLYSDWKEWKQQETNAKYPQAFRVVGGEPTVEGESLDATFFLLNGWRIKPYPGTYDLTIVGNLFDVDGGDIKVPADVDPLIPNNITVNLNTSVIVRRLDGEGSSGSGLTVEENEALFNIEGKVLEIQSRLNQPVEATITDDQFVSIEEMKEMITELWTLHGLDPNTLVRVAKDGRQAGLISQTFVEKADKTVEITRD